MKINSNFEKIDQIPKISYKEDEMTNYVLHKWLKNTFFSHSAITGSDNLDEIFLTKFKIKF